MNTKQGGGKTRYRAINTLRDLRLHRHTRELVVAAIGSPRLVAIVSTSTPGVHDKDLPAAIVDRILERGRVLRLDEPAIRSKHLGLDNSTEVLAPGLLKVQSQNPDLGEAKEDVQLNRQSFRSTLAGLSGTHA